MGPLSFFVAAVPSNHLLNIQIFGLNKSQATRAAERFFKERRAPIQLFDLKKSPFPPSVFRRFLDRFGWDQLLDREGKSYVNGGLQYLKLTDQDLMQRIENDPALLRLPFVRAANRLSVGHDPAGWNDMVDLPIR